MFWESRTEKWAGVALLLLVALVIINIALVTAAVGDADPTKREDIEGILRDINDEKALFALGTASSIATDAVLLPLVAVLLYLVFCARSRALALLGLVGFASAAVMFLVADAASVAVAFLAEDFVEDGGPGGIAAGDPLILESARAVAAVAALMEPTGTTVLALGLLAVGTLVAWAPQAEVNPPRWLGGLAIVSGLAMVISWVGAASADAGVAIVTLGYVGTMLFFAILGGWLLVRPESETRPASGLAYGEPRGG
jgi:hypothetical protein